MKTFSVHIQLFLSSLSFLGCLCGQQLSIAPGNSPIFLKVGDEFAVMCKAPGRNEHALQWRKDPGTVIHTTRQRIYTEWLGNISGLMLVLGKVEPSDSGNYSCHDKQSKEKVTFQLFVQEPMEFKDTPLEQNGTAGDAVFTVRCEATGTPTPLIKWKSDWRALLPPKFEPVADGLVIRDVSPDDAGDYRCLAMQENFPTFKLATIRVNVLYEPRWKEENVPSVLFLVNDKKVVLSCKGKSFPPPNITWFYNQQTLPQQTPELEVSEPGSYVCQLANPLGTLSRNFTVLEGHLPGRPGKAKARNTTLNSIYLDFAPPKPSKYHNITGYKIELKDKQGKHNKHVNLSNGPPFLITDLRPDTTYVIRLKAENAIGFGDYSLEVEAKTSQAPTSFKISAVTFAFTIILMILA